MAALPWWKLTRNRYTRKVYETLDGLGITATEMYRYRRELDGGESLPSPSAPDGVRLEVRRPDTVPDDRFYGADAATASDWVTVASTNDAVVGTVVVSDRPVYVAPLKREITPTGAYVWRLHVVPAHRNRGIATALVADALLTVVERFGAAAAAALIAVDNRPSRWVFEANGFEPVARLSYYRVLGFERRSERPLSDEP